MRLKKIYYIVLTLCIIICGCTLYFTMNNQENKEQDDKIEIIEEKYIPSHIRVLISKTGYNGYEHKQIKVTSNKSFTVIKDGEKKEYKGNEIITIHKNDFQKQVSIQASNNKIKVLSIKRLIGNPVYRGTLELTKSSTGIYMVNEVKFEEYLYGVVPSEMPTGYGEEAAKVQAICARSYSYNMLQKKDYVKYNADVDDSTSCQVYNNILENKQSIKAVKETEGYCLIYKGKVISANYFSTSCGTTSNVNDVWKKHDNSQAKEYLVGKIQNDNKDQTLDLSSEKEFSRFIEDKNFESYDQEYPAYRWNVTMNMTELTRSVNRNLKQRYEANKNLIQVYDKEKKQYSSKSITTIGIVKNIQIHQRSKTGQILSIIITGSDAKIKVITEYNIRKLLAPKKYKEEDRDIFLHLKDGTYLKNYGLLPSGYFKIKEEVQNKKITALTFIGGGMGHGVGMSQNGVRTLVDRGMKYASILQHYYTGIEIKKLY